MRGSHGRQPPPGKNPMTRAETRRRLRADARGAPRPGLIPHRASAWSRPRAPRLLTSKIRFSLLALVSIATAACGYHTAGHASTLPTEIKTIAVPAFANNTETYKVEQMLTAAVVR